MTKLGRIEHRILAVDPTHRGFGYVVFEGPDFLVDWGVRNVEGAKNLGCVRAVARLMERYAPDALVIEDWRAGGCRRRERVRGLINELTELAKRNSVRVHRMPRTKVNKVFAGLGATNKHQIACAIAEQFPELTSRLPPERKPWMSEDIRMAIFDAAAMVLVCLRSAVLAKLISCMQGRRDLRGWPKANNST